MTNMSDSRVGDLLSAGDRLFSKKFQLDTLWQILAEEFYPERADFTRSRVDGDEYAEGLYESVPPQNRRELGNAIGAVLRPRGKNWYKLKIRGLKRGSDQAEQWLDWARERLRDLLYARRSGYQLAMSMGDHDFVSFGNRVTAITEGRERDGVRFDLVHLRDIAAAQNRYGEVDTIHRKYRRTLRDVMEQFGEDGLSASQKSLHDKDPYAEIELRHVCIPSAVADVLSRKGKKANKGKPYTSITINCEARTILREGGYFEFPYAMGRWERTDSSPYGYSPAAMLGLIDARLLQAQSRMILDAAERVIDPPMIATRDAVLGGVNTYPGSVSWIDADYDERLGQALRPLETGANIPLGLEMKQDTRQILMSAWHLNKLNLPSDKEMTAYETGERIAEYIRSIGPILEPPEVDNAAVLDVAFTIGMRIGWFGSTADIPQELRGKDVEFEFDTPVALAYARQKVARAQETVTVAAMIAQATGRPDVFDNIDMDDIARSAIKGIDGEAKWLVPEDAVRAKREQAAQTAMQAQAKEEAAQNLQAVNGVAGTVQNLAAANQSLPALMQGGEPARAAPMPNVPGLEELLEAA